MNATRTREGMHYYGWARNEKGKWEQLLVTFPDNRMTQAWTGVIYKSFKAAEADVERINLELACERDLNRNAG
jgi:hypothetical protein